VVEELKVERSGEGQRARLASRPADGSRRVPKTLRKSERVFSGDAGDGGNWQALRKSENFASQVIAHKTLRKMENCAGGLLERKELRKS